MERLRIFVDILAAPSWLALGPVLAMLGRLHTTTEWQPFTSPGVRVRRAQNEETAEITVVETVGQRHQRVRQEYRDHDQHRYARWQGIPMARPAASVDRLMLDFALLLASDNGTAGHFLTQVGRHYWSGASAPMDADWLGRALGMSDLVSNFLAEGDMRLGAARHEAEELGIFDAPVLLVGEEQFLGRQHLPLVERRLTGIHHDG